MKSFEFDHYDNDIVAYDGALCAEFPLGLFEPDGPLLRGKGEAGVLYSRGRGKAHVVTHDGQALVLRHYYRGGMAARFFHDVYLWRGLYKTRAIAELQMLAVMREMDLPVPVPVAARIHRAGLVYKADIVTRLIPQAKSLGFMLQHKALSRQVWKRIGGVIRMFHDNNCNHADLNAHNILLNEEGRVFLIDFDKSSIDQAAGRWRQANLARLRRSLMKLSNAETTFHYSAEDFRALMEGYSH